MFEEFHQDHINIAAHCADWRWDNARNNQWSSCQQEMGRARDAGTFGRAEPNNHLLWAVAMQSGIHELLPKQVHCGRA